MQEKKTFNAFKIVRIFLFFVLMYMVITNTGLDVSDIPQDYHIGNYTEIGTDAGNGNFVGIQPYMLPIDYASKDHFYRKMEAYFEAAALKGWLGEKTIVVLPEYLGTWLVAQGERKSVYTASTTEQAMRSIVIRNLADFAGQYFKAKADDKAKAALFTIKSPVMAITYQEVFASLAAKYGVSIVAGSIILSNPKVERDSLITRPGELYNISALFRPDGSIDPKLVYKAYPIDDEKPFCGKMPASSIPVFDTNAGKLGVLICADSWYPDAYQQLQTEGATLLAIPSYSAPDSLWQTPWLGYNGAPAPADVDQTDIGQITEQMAWLKYSMGGRAGSAGINTAINVFLRGKIWDLGSDGSTIHYHNGGIKVDAPEEKSAISCLWF